MSETLLKILINPLEMGSFSVLNQQTFFSKEKDKQKFPLLILPHFFFTTLFPQRGDRDKRNRYIVKSYYQKINYNKTMRIRIKIKLYRKD